MGYVTLRASPFNMPELRWHFGYFGALEQWYLDGGLRPIAEYVDEGLRPLRLIWSASA